MALIKQKTIEVGGEKTTVQLIRQKNQHPDLSNNQYQYLVKEEGGARFEDPVFTKKEGMSLFEEVVSDVRRGMELRLGTSTDSYF